MSGLLNSQRPCRRAQSRASSGVSPSSAAAPDVGQPERVQGPQLVGGQRLGRRQVERGGPGVGGEPGEHRQLVGQRLARTRCRWPPRRPCRRGPARPPPPGGSTARPPRGRPAPVAPAAAPRPATATCRALRGGIRTAWRSGPSAPATSGDRGPEPSAGVGRRPDGGYPEPASTRRSSTAPRSPPTASRLAHRADNQSRARTAALAIRSSPARAASHPAPAAPWSAAPPGTGHPAPTAPELCR